jgi:hypothetical protein
MAMAITLATSSQRQYQDAHLRYHVKRHRLPLFQQAKLQSVMQRPLAFMCHLLSIAMA